MSVEAAPGAGTAAHTASFVESLLCGRLRGDLLFPYPQAEQGERERVASLIRSFREFAAESVDARKIERERWIGDDVVAGLGERGLLGLNVPEEYGGQGLSSTGYARVCEVMGEVDPTLAIVMGIHQSIGMRAIVLFANDEQKARFLPDLAAARRLAAFALTEPLAGSDAASMRTRAVRQADGSWLLNGEKRYIGNGDKGQVLVTFARCEDGDREGHIALIVEKGMPGFEPGERYDMMGLAGNDVRRLYFKDVRIPPENVLGEPGDGFRIATETLKTGRLSLGAACVGIAKRLRRLSVEHTIERQQFGYPLAAFEMVQEKVAWMAENTFAADSMVYLTTALVDRGVPDPSLETALLKVFSTEFVLEAANMALVLRGGEGYMRSHEFEKCVRDVRIYSIFEGANDVLRAFVSMTGLKASAKLAASGALASPPPGPLPVHAQLAGPASALSGQTERLGATVVSLATAHGPKLRQLQMHQRRLADALVGIYAQTATLSRMTALLEEAEVRNGDGPPAASQLAVAEAFCSAADARVTGLLDSVEANDDDRTRAVARIAYGGGTAADAFQPSDWGL